MHLEHVRPFVESRLILGISLGLIRREAQIPQRRRRTTLPEEAIKARSIVCLAPAVSVTLATLVLNPSAETETS